MANISRCTLFFLDSEFWFRKTESKTVLLHFLSVLQMFNQGPLPCSYRNAGYIFNMLMKRKGDLHIIPNKLIKALAQVVIEIFC